MKIEEALKKQKKVSKVHEKQIMTLLETCTRGNSTQIGDALELFSLEGLDSHSLSIIEEGASINNFEVVKFKSIVNKIVLLLNKKVNREEMDFILDAKASKDSVTTGKHILSW